MLGTMNYPEHCFALLDDHTDGQARSRFHSGYLGSLYGWQGADLAPMLLQMQEQLRQGRYAVGVFQYELGQAQIEPASAPARSGNAAPLFEILLFEQCQIWDQTQVAQWLAQQAPDQPAGIAKVRANITEAAFAAALGKIHDYIAAGDTYQVNYTYRLHFDMFGDPATLYQRLRQRQPVPYGALICLPDGRALLSLSPELFVHHAGQHLTARPMKGTAEACANDEQNRQRAAMLANDEKNRAENLMIVDLLRNDLGRLAEIGSVQVPALFDVTRFGDVLQMTSTITARLAHDRSLPEIFQALYPCGSITGAPKRRTMEIIAELETAPRGIYTGAIGWFDASAPGATVGDFCLSVPIRTLALAAPDQDGIRHGEMGVGAGIVYDSVAAEEFQECQLKARFLSGLGHTFQLFETMRVSHETGCPLLVQHLQRLEQSARYFGFAFDHPHLVALIQQTCADLPSGSGPHRLKLSLNYQGQAQIETAALGSPTQEPVRVLTMVRENRTQPLFFRHKTTIRADYDATLRMAEAEGAFDVLMFDQAGQLTEGCRTNVFVKLNGRWWTPPLCAGVLPGVMRAQILADPNWQAGEKVISREDLRNAQEIVVCNALRGVLRAKVKLPAV